MIMASKKDQKSDDKQPSNPIFYQNPVFLDKSIHGEMSVDPKLNFGFAKEQIALPVNAIEFTFLMKHYPIIFIGEEKTTPAVFLGLQPNQNLFVNKKGEWEEKVYVPAYARRYPFIMSEDKENDRLILCVDDNKDVLVKNNKKPLFDGEEMSETTKEALEFCKSYHQASLQTNSFCEKLKELDLLSPFNHALLRNLGFNQLYTIDEKKMNELSDEKFLELKKTGTLALVYAQLFSMNNWQTLFDETQKDAKK